MNKVCVKILEQPNDSIRFRYKSENKSIIYGVNSTLKQRTFPSIQIKGYEGRAEVVVSCVTKDRPYRPHPHILVGRKECKQGICRIKVNDTTNIVTFSNLSIQCVTKKDIKKVLNERQALGIDPFKTGFKLDSDIDLNAVRLCFQVKLNKSNGKCILPPLKSNIIYNTKIRPSLVLHELSHSDAAVGQKVILLCEKIADENDIEVRVFEENEGKVVWEKIIDSDSIRVHKQVALQFKTPKYRSQKVGIYQVKVQLRRLSDQTMSNQLPFNIIQLSLDQSSNVVEVDSFSYGESVRSSLPPASFSHDNVETVPLSQMQWSSENVPIQKQQHQTNIPMMPSIPAPTSTQSGYEHQWEPNLLNEAMSENQPVTNNLYSNDAEVPSSYDTSFLQFLSEFSLNNLDPLIAYPECGPFTERNNDIFPLRQQQEYQSTGFRIWNRAPDIPASTNVQSRDMHIQQQSGRVRIPEDQERTPSKWKPKVQCECPIDLSKQKEKEEKKYVRSIDLEEKKEEDCSSSFNGSFLSSVKENVTKIANLFIHFSGLSISGSIKPEASSDK